MLWSCCPMVTLPLERMASRVAASLCAATGLGHEMIVSSQQEYEEKVSGPEVPREGCRGQLCLPRGGWAAVHVCLSSSSFEPRFLHKLKALCCSI